MNCQWCRKKKFAPPHHHPSPLTLNFCERWYSMLLMWGWEIRLMVLGWKVFIDDDERSLFFGLIYNWLLQAWIGCDNNGLLACATLTHSLEKIWWMSLEFNDFEKWFGLKMKVSCVFLFFFCCAGVAGTISWAAANKSRVHADKWHKFRSRCRWWMTATEWTDDDDDRAGNLSFVHNLPPFIVRPFPLLKH